MNEEQEVQEFNEAYYDPIIEDDEGDEGNNNDYAYNDMNEPDDDPDDFRMMMLLGEADIADFHYMGFQGEEAWMAYENTDR